MVILQDPPLFYHLASDPIRWAILRELAVSDRKVEDLCEAVGKAQNAVSYHLKLLRDAEVVTFRRSSHDRRDMYHRLNLARCSELLAAAGQTLHPALASAPTAVNTELLTSRQPSVLFLCTANSARSQMAEGLLREKLGGGARVASAGSAPSTVHPNAVRAMKKRGIDISSQTSKHFDSLNVADFQLVVTVCDHLKEECPEVPPSNRKAHWSIPDPVSEGEDAGKLSAFERVADELDTRIQFLIATLK